MGSNLVKSPLRYIIKTVVVHPLSSLAIVVAVAVGFFFVSGRVPQPFLAQAGSPAATTQVMAKGNMPASAATEDFMHGQASFNAELVWNSLSDNLHSSLASQGGTIEALQEQLDQYRQEGRFMDNFTYVGGFSPASGTTFYFYVATIRRPELGGQPDNVFFAFTVDPTGKILSVE